MTDGSGGKNINTKPAAESKVPSNSQQRHASGCHEAGHDGTEKRRGLTTTIQKATKRRPTASNNALTKCAANAIRMVRGSWTRPKQVRRARVHPPERNRKQRLVSSTKQRNPTRCQQRDAAAGTTCWRWSAAAHQDGTQITTRHRQGQSSHNAGRNALESHAPKVSRSAHPPRWQGAKCLR